MAGVIHILGGLLIGEVSLAVVVVGVLSVVFVVRKILPGIVRRKPSVRQNRRPDLARRR